MLNRLKELETAVAHKSRPLNGERPYFHQSGSLPILISAPHATAHRRRNRLKREEGFTGGMAHLLAETTGAHALYCCYQSPDDPNWDPRSPYKTELKNIVNENEIQFVLDLHGMSNRHKIGLALGSMNGRSCPRQEPTILETLSSKFIQTNESTAKSFLRLRWDHFVLNHSRFTGGVTNQTITRFVSQQLGIPALQVELCAAVRVVANPTSRLPFPPYRGQPEPILQTVAALQAVIQKIAIAL
ncbi:MAG: hypothetical protein DHS20C20_28250 [Ardenticatenaceae bacterium]|nr:MAG: hypothetical protein DHS20C20_28250 [Ardenticatenaceae bacterium]